MFLLSFVVWSLFSKSFGTAKPVARWDNFEVKHSWEDIPRGWTLHDSAPLDHVFQMRIALRQGKHDKLITTLIEVSDPAHAKYGQHLSKEEVEALTAPPQDTVDIVDSWLTANDINLTSVQRIHGGSWLSLPVTVEQASQMLNATYNIFQHATTGEYVVRTTSYSLPSSLNSHILLVTPTTYFSTMNSILGSVPSFIQKTKRGDPADGKLDGSVSPVSLSAVPADCARIIVPSCLSGLYNTSTYVPQATSTNQLGIAGFSNQFANDADLQDFYELLIPDAVGSTFQIMQVNGGGNDQSNPGIIADIDIEYAESISFPTPNIFYSTAGVPPFNPVNGLNTTTNQPFLDLAMFLLKQPSIPATVSTSYVDDEETVPLDYANTVCNLFLQFGIRGSTAIFTSGQNGVGGQCTTHQFQPQFPATCPFVTSVGGTTSINPEVGLSFSGGGFSNYFSTGFFQVDAVSAFMLKASTMSQIRGRFNMSGRGYPDVAAQGTNFELVFDGREGTVSGTSISSPIFAGVIALLNDFLISQGKPTLGFMNILLYSTLFAGFNDITSGINPNPACGSASSNIGFKAVPGWDPVTGWGTPDFAKLQALVG